MFYTNTIQIKNPCDSIYYNYYVIIFYVHFTGLSNEKVVCLYVYLCICRESRLFSIHPRTSLVVTGQGEWFKRTKSGSQGWLVLVELSSWHAFSLLVSPSVPIVSLGLSFQPHVPSPLMLFPTITVWTASASSSLNLFLLAFSFSLVLFSIPPTPEASSHLPCSYHRFPFSHLCGISVARPSEHTTAATAARQISLFLDHAPSWWSW